MSGRNRPCDGVRWTLWVNSQALLVAILAVFLAFPGVAIATRAPDTGQTARLMPDLLEDQIAVREMMRLEIEQALQRQRKPAAGGSVSPAIGTVVRQAPGAPRLQAIYGVGQRLLAEVLWKGQSYIYLKGQLLPAGRKGETDIPQLKSISERCVTLQGSGGVFELCLGVSGEEG